LSLKGKATIGVAEKRLSRWTMLGIKALLVFVAVLDPRRYINKKIGGNTN
jgi:hypothetical protein